MHMYIDLIIYLTNDYSKCTCEHQSRFKDTYQFRVSLSEPQIHEKLEAVYTYVLYNIYILYVILHTT